MSYCNSSTVWHSITWRQLPPGYCPPCPPRVPCRVSCHMMNTDVSVQTCVCAVESCDRATPREQHQRQGDVWHGRGKRRSVTTLRTRDQRPEMLLSWVTTDTWSRSVLLLIHHHRRSIYRRTADMWSMSRTSESGVSVHMWLWLPVSVTTVQFLMVSEIPPSSAAVSGFSERKSRRGRNTFPAAFPEAACLSAEVTR